MKTVLKGNYHRKEEKYIYKHELILSDRDGSIVEVYNDRVVIEADILGIDILYYIIDGEDLVVSNNFRDFLNYEIDEQLLPLQLSFGQVPYPFTILKGVRKALPGIRIEFSKSNKGKWDYVYDSKSLLNNFIIKDNYDVNNFKNDFLQLIERNKSRCDRNILSCLSGSFDSLLLTDLFREHLIGICHYSDTQEDASKLENTLRSFLPNIPWHHCCGKNSIAENDLVEYFDAVDEPNFDISGLAEFLLIKKALNFVNHEGNVYILTGVLADSLFFNDRGYFKEWLLQNLFFNQRFGLVLQERIKTNTIFGKIIDYCKSSKTRFGDFNQGFFMLPKDYKAEISKVFDLYSRSLRQERCSFFGELLLLLRSFYLVEKMKTVIRCFNIGYLLPFWNREMIQLAFSVPSKYKVGYGKGKRIIREVFPVINNLALESSSFIPRKLWNSVLKKNFHASEIFEYSFNIWLHNRKVNL